VSLTDPVVWLIIALFYAPLHYLLPVLFLFMTGQEDAATRKRLIRRAFINATLSMAAAFALAIWLARQGRLVPAMLVLLATMLVPFVHIFLHRRELRAPTGN